jgi:hypothetical protein
MLDSMLGKCEYCSLLTIDRENVPSVSCNSPPNPFEAPTLVLNQGDSSISIWLPYTPIDE